VFGHPAAAFGGGKRPRVGARCQRSHRPGAMAAWIGRNRVGGKAVSSGANGQRST
jgi:hypothetical protein